MEDFNIGTTNDPKLIKISKNLLEQARREYLALLKKYTKFSAWMYADLKVYDTFSYNILSPSKRMLRISGKRLGGLTPFCYL